MILIPPEPYKAPDSSVPDYLGVRNYAGRSLGNGGDFQIFASLEETTEPMYPNPDASSVEDITKAVTRALDFVATGQPPDPTWVSTESPDYFPTIRNSPTDAGDSERPKRAATVRTGPRIAQRGVSMDTSPGAAFAVSRCG